MAEPENELDQEPLSATILAYFELLQGWQVPLTLETESGVELEGFVEALDPERQRLTLAIRNAPAAGLDPNNLVKVYFGMEESRWMGCVPILHHRDHRRSFVLALPKRLEARDRRKWPRVRSLQGLSVLIHPSEFKGGAYQGVVVDLSEGGLQVRIEPSGSPPPETAGEGREGQELELVQVLGLGPETLEASGLLIHKNRTAAGLVVGVRFRNLKGDSKRRLETFLRPLVLEPLAVLPVLGRPSLSNLGAGFPGSSDFDQKELPTEPGRSPEEALEAASPPPAPNLRERILRQRQAVALVMPPGPGREELTDFLSREGFSRVLPAGTVAELVRALQFASLGLAFIDWPDGNEQSLAIATFLAGAIDPGAVALVVAASQPSPQFILDAQAIGVAKVVLRPYALSPTLSEMLGVCLMEPAPD